MEQDFNTMFEAIALADEECGQTPPRIPEASANQENKFSTTPISKSRVVVDRRGKTRRPVNLTLEDELSIAMKILAAKRQVPPCKLINEALRRYLIEEGELKE